MGTSHPTPQSPAERRTAEAELRGLVTKFAPDYQRLTSTTRRWLRRRLPTSHEIVYAYRDCFVISFSPSERGYEGVFSVRGSASGVRLYFSADKVLPDPEKLLRGTGTRARYIELESESTLARPAVVRLFDEAIARNRVPYPRTGRGSVVIRSDSARQRRRRRPA